MADEDADVDTYTHMHIHLHAHGTHTKDLPSKHEKISNLSRETQTTTTIYTLLKLGFTHTYIYTNTS